MIQKFTLCKVFCFLSIGLFSQFIVHQTGIRNNLYPELIIVDKEDLTTRVNDSTVVLNFNPKEDDCLFVLIDTKTRWFDRVWLKPNYKKKEVTINYQKKTINILKPDEWDIVTKKVIEFDTAEKQNEADSVSFAYINTHRDSYLSLWFLYHGMLRNDVKKKHKALLLLDSTFKNNSEYKQIKASLTQRKIPKIGNPFIEFELSDIRDSIFNSRSINDKWIFINFWSNGCGPCVREMDALVNFYRELDLQKAEFISIALDSTKEIWRNSKTTNKIIWPSVWQEGGVYGELCLNYNLMAMPYFVVFDKNKKIVYMNDGSDQLDYIKSMFKEKGLLK